MLIFGSSRSLMFFKIGVLKNFATFTGKHLCRPLQAFFYRTPTVAASGFSRKQFFQLNLVFNADSCTGFCSELLYKQELNLRSSHWNSSVKKGVLRKFSNFTGKHLCWSLFLIEVFLQISQISQENTKKEIPAEMFSCEFCEISHNIFFKEPFGWLLQHKRSLCLLS